MRYQVNLTKRACGRVPQGCPGTEASREQKQVPWATTAPHPGPYELKKLAPIPRSGQSQDSRQTPRKVLSRRGYRPSAVRIPWRCHRQSPEPLTRLHALVRRSDVMTSIESEQASTMKYGGDFDDLISEAIHNAVVAVGDLADRLVAKLRHYPSGARVLLKSAHRGNDPVNDEVGVASRVACNIRADRVDVLDRLGSPDDSDHRRSRRFTSAWSTPCPASSSTNPRSIFAKRTKRSIASSSVASAGSFSIASRTFCLALPLDIGASLAAITGRLRITESGRYRRRPSVVSQFARKIPRSRRGRFMASSRVDPGGRPRSGRSR